MAKNKISAKFPFYKSLLSIIICVPICLSLSCPAFSQTGYDDIQKRIETLEKEIAKLKSQLEKEKTEQSGETRPSSEKTPPITVGSESRGFNIKPYGYIKLDAAYDDSETNYGNFILYVPEESTNKNDNEFKITARQTRLGLNVAAPDYNGWSTRGNIEFDFYGNGSTVHENKAGLMLRHAYLKLEKGNLGVVAGQTWDVFSPLNPHTLNYTVGWSAGNIGYRRPQLRITHYYPLDDGKRFITGIGIARTSGLTNEDLDQGGQNDGEDAGFPTLQARFALAGKYFLDKESVLGISGHYGKEEIDWGEGVQKLKSWSLNLDFNIHVSNSISLKGEIFTGLNLDDYFGGSLQGINTDSHNAIQSTGGWSQVNYKLNDSWQYNAGAGFDNPDDEDLNTGMRSKNSFIYFNALYTLFTPLTIGVEYSYWDTEYLDMGDGKDNRVQTSVIYKW